MLATLAVCADPRSSAADGKDDEASTNPGTNLFVTGIHPRLSEADVTQLFEKYGKIVQDAGDEIAIIDQSKNPPVVRLTEEAKRLARLVWPDVGPAAETTAASPAKP